MGLSGLGRHDVCAVMHIIIIIAFTTVVNLTLRAETPCATIFVFLFRHGFVCDPSALVSAAACEATDLELEHDTLPPRVLDMSLRAYTSASPDMRHLTDAAVRATVKETAAAEAAALKHVGLLTHAEYDGT